MWMAHQINPSNYGIVRRFDIVIAVAKIMRGCHFYYVSIEDKKIYGIPENAFAIREIPLPNGIEATTSFMFRLDMIDADIVNRYVDFIIYKDIPWAMFPVIYKSDAIYYQPKFKPVNTSKLWTVINSYSQEEVVFVDLYGPDGTKAILMENANALLQSYFATRNLVGKELKIFPHMERSQIVQQVFQSKASLGERYLPLKYDGQSYGMYIFKNLFALNKTDRLDIMVRDRIDTPVQFDVTFRVTHDKNPVKYIFSGDFIEDTHVSYLHLD